MLASDDYRWVVLRSGCLSIHSVRLWRCNIFVSEIDLERGAGVGLLTSFDRGWERVGYKGSRMGDVESGQKS